jgi:hypothetical protein
MDFEFFRKTALTQGTDIPEQEQPSVDVLSDDALYEQYLDEMSGEAQRRCSIEHARRDQLEREQDIKRWAEQTGSPLPRDLEE